jgi:glycerol-3-phosphate dehydrogenase (NAD(P)+)
MLQDVFPSIDYNQVGVLSGPSHAEKLVEKSPTAVVAASKIMKLPNQFRQLL